MKNPASLALIAIAFVLSITGCSSSQDENFGERVEISPTSEVYVKGGATKEEAQKLGDFLLRNNYFDTSQKSVQMVKDNDTYVIKFVVDRAKIENDEEAIIAFRFFHTLIRDSVFAGKPTKLVLTDEAFKEIKPVKEFSREELEAETDDDHDSLHTPRDTTDN